jgi:nicotinate-nucleotide pyrophosphorylase (carboxylating)
MRTTSFFWKEPLKAGLKDDGWPWDWTALGALKKSKNHNVRAKIFAKSEGIWAADGLLQALEELSEELGVAIRVKTLVKDGQKLKPGMLVMQWIGPAQGVLAFERPFLNLAAFVSGISTQTHQLVKEVDRAWRKLALRANGALPPRVSATRKTLPGYRDLAIHAVLIGGGYSHRVGLSSGVLIKENHITVAGGVRPAIQGAKEVAPHGLKIEIEVRNLKELTQAIAAGVDGVLLDNFTPAQVSTALKRIAEDRNRASMVVEVSGGITERNIAQYVQEGIHVLSIGSLTHSVKAMDLSLMVI